jgi:hypothetical protein
MPHTFLAISAGISSADDGTYVHNTVLGGHGGAVAKQLEALRALTWGGGGDRWGAKEHPAGRSRASQP